MQQDMIYPSLFWTEVQTGLPICFAAFSLSFIVIILYKYFLWGCKGFDRDRTIVMRSEDD